MKCSNCNSEFNFNPSTDRYSYGLYMGKPFCVNICPTCAKILSKEEYKKLEETKANEYQKT